MAELRDFDDIDCRMLQILQENARISNVDLAKRVGLSPAPCLRRLRALEESGVIRAFVSLLRPEAVNLAVTVWIKVRLDLQWPSDSISSSRISSADPKCSNAIC